MVVSIVQHCRHTGCQVTRKTTFCMVAPNIHRCSVQISFHLTIVTHRTIGGSKGFAKLVHLLYDDLPDEGLDEPVSNWGQLYKVFPYLKRPDWLRDLLSCIYFFGGEVVYFPSPNTNMKQLVIDLASNSHMLLSAKDSNENRLYSVYCLYIRRTWLPFVYLILYIFLAVF
jgi:hypothetical protein